MSYLCQGIWACSAITSESCQLSCTGTHKFCINQISSSLKASPSSPSLKAWINSFSQQKSTFSPQSIFNPLFLNEDGRILKNGLSKLHNRFRRYSTLTRTVLLESQYLQSYASLPDFLRPKTEEVRHFCWGKKMYHRLVYTCRSARPAASLRLSRRLDCEGGSW